MKNLSITIQGILYTTEQINKARTYADRVFDATLEVCLEDICLKWIDRAIEQREEFERLEERLSEAKDS